MHNANNFNIQSIVNNYENALSNFTAEVHWKLGKKNDVWCMGIKA